LKSGAVYRLGLLALIGERPLRGFGLTLPCVPLLAHVVALHSHVIEHRLEITYRASARASACWAFIVARPIARTVVLAVNSVQLARLAAFAAALQ
jgi:hypothetical protein